MADHLPDPHTPIESDPHDPRNQKEPQPRPEAGADQESAVAAQPETTHSGFITILGRPNVGKSTLLNTILGVKVAPITPKPQTTRRGVRGIYTEEHRQLVFVDTPGVHRGRTALDNYMKREIRAALADVEAVLWVVDLRRPPNDEDKDVARLLRNLDAEVPVFLIGNKVDAAKYPEEALELYRDLYPDADRIYTLSALNDPKAVYDLRADLLALLPEAPFYFPEDIRSDQSREEWSAELIRESAMIHLRQELPYVVAIKVNEWREPEDAEEPLYIQADIWVERRKHRPIVIGKGGKMIREIGRTARRQLELLLDHRIFLDLEVVVAADWREDPAKLRELGYEG